MGRDGTVPQKWSIFCRRLVVGGGIDIAGCDSRKVFGLGLHRNESVAVDPSAGVVFQKSCGLWYLTTGFYEDLS